MKIYLGHFMKKYCRIVSFCEFFSTIINCGFRRFIQCFVFKTVPGYNMLTRKRSTSSFFTILFLPHMTVFIAKS